MVVGAVESGLVGSIFPDVIAGVPRSARGRRV